jgi:hypothetical protein
MHVLLNLLRIKGLYMFRALLAHPQEVLHKRHLVYCLCVTSGLEWNQFHYNPDAENGHNMQANISFVIISAS